MTNHRNPSPEDRFNDYLDALVSGPSTPDASDASAASNAHQPVPSDAARELHDLAQAADSAQGGPPHLIWESIMSSRPSPTTATVDDTPRRERSSRPAAALSRAISSPASRPTSWKRRTGRSPSRRALGIAFANVALILVLLAAGFGGYRHLQGAGNDNPAPTPSVPGVAMQASPSEATPASMSDVESCLADNGLVYHTSKLSDSVDVTSKVATVIDGDDQVVSTTASAVFASSQDNIALGTGSVFTAYDLDSDETSILGYARQAHIEQLQLGPWVVAPANPIRTDWTVTYLPTMKQTAVSTAFTGNEHQPFSVQSKVSANGDTLALVVTPVEEPIGPQGSARPVPPTVLVMTTGEPGAMHSLPIAFPELATLGDLVAVSPDGSMVSAPRVSSDLTPGVGVFRTASLTASAPTLVAEAQLGYPVGDAFAFFSPSGASLSGAPLVFVADGTISSLPTDSTGDSRQTGTYEGALYGAVIAPGGDGALVGLRQTPAVSPSEWLWINGNTGEVQDIQGLEHFIFSNMHSTDQRPPVITAPVVELNTQDRESGPSFVFLDPATGTIANEIRDLAGGRVGGIGGYWMNASPDGSLILTRLDDEAFIKANRPATGERWDIPVPDGISGARLGAFPSPDGGCIALAPVASWSSDTPQPIWVVAAHPDAEPVLVAEGWFSNWYQAPVTTGP